MSRLAIETTDRATKFLPGEEIEVIAEWDLDEPAEAVEVRLVWYTRGKGDQDVSLVETKRFDFPSQSESRKCQFTLPHAPYSFSGKLISLIWALEVIALPLDDSKRIDITIAPGGEEITLQQPIQE